VTGLIVSREYNHRDVRDGVAKAAERL